MRSNNYDGFRLAEDTQFASHLALQSVNSTLRPSNETLEQAPVTIPVKLRSPRMLPSTKMKSAGVVPRKRSRCDEIHWRLEPM